MRAVLRTAEEEEAGIDAAALAMNVIADGLKGCGLDICGPEFEGWHYLIIGNTPGFPCEVSVCDGAAEWEYRPVHNAHAGPAHITGIALNLLGAGATGFRTLPPESPGPTLKSTVGRALAKSGMQVRLEIICKDESFFEVYSEIEVTNPAQPSRGRVWIADDSTLRWQCDLYGAGQETGITPAGIATAIAKALTVASSQDTRPS